MFCRCSLEMDAPPHFFSTHLWLKSSCPRWGGIRGQPAPGDIAEIHVVTTWWHQKKLSEEELINTSCSLWLGNFYAVFRIAVVRCVVVKHRVMFYSWRVNVCGLQPHSRGWV